MMTNIHPFEWSTTTTTTTTTAAFDSIPSAIHDLKLGKFIIVMDDTSRENEGDLIIASQFLTKDKMAFMIRNTSGLICSPLLPSTCDRLNLPPMVSKSNHTESHGTQYTISVDALSKTTTGISAHDRAHTCNLLADPNTSPSDFVRPGHLFPLRYTPGGVLSRRGHTEASIDLCRLANLYPAAAISELVLDNGNMMRLHNCLLFARQHQLKIISIADLVIYIRSQIISDGDWIVS